MTAPAAAYLTVGMLMGMVTALVSADNPRYSLAAKVLAVVLNATLWPVMLGWALYYECRPR